MVGVPGRSKACATCKKRRRGCDSLRPRCTPCRKSGIECGGYEISRVFINSSKKTWPQGSTYTNTSYLNVNSKQAGGGLHVIQPQSLARTAYEEQGLQLFLEAYLPRGYPHDRRDRQWMSVVGETCRDHEALTLALLANGLAAVGTRVGEAWLVKESFRMYGRSLGALNKALRMPTRGQKYCALLSASRLLSTFELVVAGKLFVGSDHESSIATRSRNWECHIKGDLALIRALGPEAFIHGDAHAVFADGRLHYYMMAAKQRRRLFVSEPAWMSVPWVETPKTRRDLLLDLLLEVPGILEDYDQMVSCRDEATRAEQRDALVTRCWELDQGLQRWAGWPIPRIGLHEQPKGVLEASSAASGQQLPLVETTALYWSGCLLLYSTLQLALGPEKQALPERADYKIYIRNLAWAIRPLLEPEAGMFGKHVAAFPLAMALQFGMILPEPRESPSDERAMLLESLKGPGCQGIRGFLVSMNADSARHPQWMSEIPGGAGVRARARRWVGVVDVPEDWLGWLEKNPRGSVRRSEDMPCEVHQLLYGCHPSSDARFV